MKLNIVRYALVLVIAMTFTNGALASDDKAEAEIQALLLEYQNALKSSNTPAIVALYTTDGVQMPPGAPSAVGKTAIETSYNATFDAIGLDLVFHIDEIDLFNKKSALLRTHSTGTVTLHTDNDKQVPAGFKELFIVKKEKGVWRFSHYSFSEATAS